MEERTLNNTNLQTFIFQNRPLLNVKLEVSRERVGTIRGTAFTAVTDPIQLLLHRLRVAVARQNLLQIPGSLQRNGFCPDTRRYCHLGESGTLLAMDGEHWVLS